MPLGVATRQLQSNKIASVDELISKRSHVADQVRSHLQKMKLAMKQQADKKRRGIDFTVGDYVWLKTDHLQLPEGLTRKFAAKFAGPFCVLA